MKEAAGEANLTVVAIILIGVIVAIATPIINNMMSNTGKRSCCQNAGGVWKGTRCTDGGSKTGLESYDSDAYDACVLELGVTK